jgi:NTE family protein
VDSHENREQPLVEGLSPVRRLPIDPLEDAPEPGVALCLSGGGYRAMLFHVGALWRLNELGRLSRLDRVSSVSGGSITAGVLADRWSQLAFDATGVAQRFEQAVVAPVRKLAGKTVEIQAVLEGIFLPGSVAGFVARRYDHELFGGATLQSLPDRPHFVFNATNLQSGVLWRFSKPYMWDYRVGKIPEPHVYDNLGLETAWKRYRTILVSDGGGHFTAKKARVDELGAPVDACARRHRQPGQGSPKAPGHRWARRRAPRRRVLGHLESRRRL